MSVLGTSCALLLPDKVLAVSFLQEGPGSNTAVINQVEGT